MRVGIVYWHLPCSDPLALDLNSRSENVVIHVELAERKNRKVFWVVQRIFWICYRQINLAYCPIISRDSRTIAWITKMFNVQEWVKGFTRTERKSNESFPDPIALFSISYLLLLQVYLDLKLSLECNYLGGYYW